MKSMLKRTTLREIKQSFGRFGAILAIVALGVGFFAGLKVTKPLMVSSVDEYLTEKNFFDLRLLSTLGFEETDVEALAGQVDVAAAEGSYSFDILCTGISENEIVLKAHSLTESVNDVELKAGRMPEAENECVVDANLVSEEEIGTRITLTDANEEDTLEAFGTREYTIVGIADSPYYMNFERGTSSLGNGKVAGFVYLPREAFVCDYYTEIFIRFSQEYAIYSEEYEAFIESKKAEWEELCEEQGTRRYEKILGEANEKLADAEQELADGKAEGEKELADAYIELTDAETEIADGKEAIADARSTLADKKEELRQQEALLAKQQDALAIQEEAYLAGVSGLLPEQQALLQNGMENQEVFAGLPVEMQQMAAAGQQIEVGKAQLAEAFSQIADGKIQLESAEKELDEQEQELLDAEKEVEEGFAEYEDGKAEFEEEIRDGEGKIADARKEVEDIEKPDTYVLGRDTNVGYVCFENDSDIVAGIANVFPLFFFMVAALVCITTMNRMVEEQRTQIGVLKALGYQETAIMSKFLFYSGSAAVLGCITGYAVGTWVFPEVIWYAYGIMYDLTDLVYTFDWKLAVICLVAALFCSMGATWFSCRYELMETAANLMRPKAPRAGKRVFLEHIPFIWNRLKFLVKVSVRNVMRYKKRFFMMIVGISGCTALLVAGFGIWDSVSGLSDKQFGEIQIADGSISLKEPFSEEDITLQEKLEEVALDYAIAAESAWDLVDKEGIKSVNVVIMQEPEKIGNYINLHTVKDVPVSYPGEGQAVISHKIAENFHIETGDTVVIRDEDMQEITVTVSGICENFVSNYLFLSEETYQDQRKELPEYKTVYLNYKEELDMHQAAASLMKLSEVSAATVNQDTAERFDNMMSSLTYIVLLIICCAAALAFIVLYNLTNINITERIREIATIKVLGFYKKETSSYVFRENTVLTAIGAAAGLIVGYFFHRFIMAQINVDMVAFDVHVRPVSYGYSILLTFLFNFIVNRFMTRKLDKINMAESLKSVD